MNLDNPARRLVTILEAGKKLRGDAPCKAAWADLLGVDQNSHELLARMAKVMELPSLAFQVLTDADPSEADNCAHWIAQLNNAFSQQNLSANWSTFIGQIDGHSIRYLKMHAKILGMGSNRKAIDPAELGKVRAELEGILTEVLASEEIALAPKKYLVRNLRKLITAIDEFHLTGSEAIFDAIEVLVGHAAFDQDYKESLTKNATGSKLTDCLQTLANLVTVAQGYKELVAPITTLLLGSNS